MVYFPSLTRKFKRFYFLCVLYGGIFFLTYKLFSHHSWFKSDGEPSSEFSEYFSDYSLYGKKEKRFLSFSENSNNDIQRIINIDTDLKNPYFKKTDKPQSLNDLNLKAKKFQFESTQNEERLIMKKFLRPRLPDTKVLDGKANPIKDPHPKGSEITLLTINNPDYSEIIDQHSFIMRNRQEYCDLYGYTNVFIDKYQINDIRKYRWLLLDAIYEAVYRNPETEWIWYLDSNAIIMNPDRDLASHILHPQSLSKLILLGSPIKVKPDTYASLKMPLVSNPQEINLIVSQDFAGINLGSFLIRNKGNFIDELFKKWEKMYSSGIKLGDQNSHQAALAKVLLQDEYIRSKTAFIPQRYFNSYPIGGLEMGWRKGDLVVHLAGCWVANECEKLWHEFWPKRTLASETHKAKDLE